MTNDNLFLRAEAAELLLIWARKALPHYGPSGSMDLDLLLFPDADGPSFYNQLAHYALLLLSEGIVPGANPEEAERFRQAALRNIQYMRDITDADFLTPHYSRGREWGKLICEWQYNFFFRSAKIIHQRELGSPAFRSDLDRVILGGTTKLAGMVRERGVSEFPGNHFTWTALLLYEVGQHYGDRGLMAQADRAFAEKVLPFQQEYGGWPEGGGIVVTYALVTAHAVSDYAALSGNLAARAAVERAFPFFQFFSFSDGTYAATADCRTRYSRLPLMFLPHGFLRIVGGPEFCLDRIRTMRRHLEEHKPTDNGAQALAFYADFVERLLRDDSAETRGARPMPQVSTPQVVRLENDEWTAFLSYQTNAESPSGFHLDSQNFIEARHRTAGYVLGGGNSKYAPRFSTFRKVTGTRGYIPTDAALAASSQGDAVCEYVFDGDKLVARMVVRDEELHVGFAMLHQRDPRDIYEAAVFLIVRPGEEILFSDSSTPVRADPTRRIQREFAAGACEFIWRGLTFVVPEGAILNYPLIPHNPYTQDSLPSREEYVARLSVRLSNRQSRIVIRPARTARPGS